MMVGKHLRVIKKESSFENDQWFLYHVEEDFTESTNLAEKYPKKLAELQKLWFKEAKKYGALPLTDVFIEGFISVPADALRAKNHYTYYRGMDRLTDSAAALTINRSHEMKIPIDRDHHK